MLTGIDDWLKPSFPCNTMGRNAREYFYLSKSPGGKWSQSKVLARDWMCPLPETLMLEPNHWCDGIGGGGLWQVIRPWGLNNGISALITPDRPESSSPFLSCQGHRRQSSMNRKRVLTRQQIYRYLDLGLPASVTVSNNYYCLRTTQSVIFCYSNPNRLRQCSFISVSCYV